MRALTVLCALGAADFSLWFPPCKHRDALQAADGDHTELLRKFRPGPGQTPVYLLRNVRTCCWGGGGHLPDSKPLDGIFLYVFLSFIFSDM